MCHAFFAVCTCKQAACYKNFEAHGMTGRGVAWQYAAFAVQPASAKVLGLELELQRGMSLRGEYRLRPEHFDHWELR